jgi:hypothetical protein
MPFCLSFSSTTRRTGIRTAVCLKCLMADTANKLLQGATINVEGQDCRRQRLD